MNYRHIYHAGNFADVVKHCTLLALINSLKTKPKPFAVLDTHAGIGLYDLHSEETQKTLEYQAGIEKLFLLDNSQAPELLQQYFNVINEYNPGGELHFYPGSPLFIAATLRNEDKLIACELHPEDHLDLKYTLRKISNAHVHHVDAYHGLKAFLPPKENRGLVFIDPPFEKTTEYDDLISALKKSLLHWRNGIFNIWYPIKDQSKVETFHHALFKLNFPCLKLKVDFSLKNLDAGLTSFGIAIINPPWKLEETLKEMLNYLSYTLDCDWEINMENLNV